MAATPVTEIDEYVCNLGSFDLDIAKEQLRETEESRNNALDTMRAWIAKNPRLVAIRYGKSLKIIYLIS